MTVELPISSYCGRLEVASWRTGIGNAAEDIDLTQVALDLPKHVLPPRSVGDVETVRSAFPPPS